MSSRNLIGINDVIPLTVVMHELPYTFVCCPYTVYDLLLCIHSKLTIIFSPAPAHAPPTPPTPRPRNIYIYVIIIDGHFFAERSGHFCDIFSPLQLQFRSTLGLVWVHLGRTENIFLFSFLYLYDFFSVFFMRHLASGALIFIGSMRP